MNVENGKKLKSLLGNGCKEYVNLKNYTSIKIGGVADYFFEAKKIEDLIKAVMTARECKVPFFILGSGSNILVSDVGFAGLVIHNTCSNISITSSNGQIIADSGVKLSSLIVKAVSAGLGGLETFYGIPGTLGGAVYGNSGAYGAEIFDFIKNVTLLTPNNKLINKTKEWFQPEYHSTKLKKDHDKNYIILTVKLQLANNKKEQLIEKINKIKKVRDEKLGGLGPSCGSIFKNPKPGKSYLTKEEAKKNSAGYILENIGAKKMQIGDAGIFSRHANIIENKKNAKAIEVRMLIDKMREEAYAQTGKNLEEEIEYIGQWE